MMGASAISGICNLAPPNLPYHRDRDPARKANVREHDALLSRMLKHGRSFETHHPEHANPNARVCSCGMESASTSGQSTRRVSLPAVQCRDASTSIEKVLKQRLHQRASEKWRMDLHVDVPESVRRKQKRRAALAALALAGYVSSASAAEALMLDSPAPTMTVAALEAPHGTQIQRQEWELATASAPTLAPNLTRAPPVQDVEEDAFYAWKQVQKEMVGGQKQREVGCVPEDDSFSAWRQIEKEMGFEGVGCIAPQSMEDDPFYAWRGIQKEMAPVPKSPVKKAVAASVAVAVAGSVAGAASAAGRAVASSGGTTAVATSLTVLHHSALPGSTLLAKIAQHLGGGGVAGAIGATAVYPLDTIKTRMQAQSLEGEEPQYKDEIDCFKQLITKEGPASLYSGLVPQLLGIAPEKAMKLTVNEALLSSLETMMPGARVWALEFIAGGGGGASQVVFTNPMEIVKVRLQTQRDGAPKKELWTIVKELGLKGLYDGAGVTLARDVPSSAIFFAVYTLLRGLYPDQSFLAGAIAAIPATVLVTPMDIIKTRLQKEPAPGEQQYTDWWECLQDIVSKEGPQALFKGSLLRVLRTSPQFGITLMLYGILCGDGS